MDHLKWSPSQSETVYRGLKTIATLNGSKPLSKLDTDLINGIQSHILYSDLHHDGAEQISAEEFAKSFGDAAHAEQALQFLIIMPYTDVEASKHKVSMVDNFAKAMNIHPETIALLHEARDRHVMAMEFCIFRKLAPNMVKGDTMLAKFGTLSKNIGLRKYDQDVALKYERLGLLPEGTLGRAIWQFYRTRGFTFPGEGHMNMNEDFILVHDVSHILGGYDTTVDGEIMTSALQGGFMKEHGWLFAVIGVLDFHLGLDAYTGPSHVQTGHLVPEKFAAALERGMNMTKDLSVDWDPWPLMGRTLADLRKEYNIIGAEDIHHRSPEGWWAVPPEIWWKF